MPQAVKNPTKAKVGPKAINYGATRTNKQRAGFKPSTAKTIGRLKSKKAFSK